MMRITETVKQLIIINILFFIGTLIVGNESYRILTEHYFENPDFKIWQLVTNMFMHANFEHLLFNMLGLFFFGPVLEQIWGGKKFLFFYISCGIGASLIQQFIHYFAFHDSLNILLSQGFNEHDIIELLRQGKIDTRWYDHLSSRQWNNLEGSFFSVALGASGAIYGVLVAFAFLFPESLIYVMFIIPVRAKYFVAAIIVMDLVSGVSGQAILGSVGGIGYFAHLGGALIGFLIMWYWKKNQFNKNRWN